MNGLGIDLRLIIFQLINFLLLMGILTYLLHKPILKLIETRQKEIKQGLENAAKAKEALENAEAQQKEMLTAAERQGHELIEEVRAQAKDLEKVLENRAAEHADKMIQRAEQEIMEERERLHTELKGELAELVVKATGKVLHENLHEEKRAQIEKMVKDLS